MPTTNGFHPINSARTVHFAPDACLELRPASAACGRCRDACPVKAFDWSASGVRLKDACVSCGQCAPVCSTGALVVDGFDLPTGLVQGASILRIECRRVPAKHHRPGTVVVPCLGGLSLSDLLALAAEGHQAIELMDRGWCGKCPAGEDSHPAADALEAVALVLDLLDLPSRPKPSLRQESLPEKNALPLVPGADGQPLARRAFFGALLRRTVEITAPEAPTASPTRGACRPSPVAAATRRHWANTLARLAESNRKPLLADFFPALEITSNCAHHTVCAAACPSGALGIFETVEGKVGLDFDAGLCVACGLCVRHCPSHAVRLLPTGNSQDTYQPGRQVLVEHTEQTCPRCSKTFVSRPSQTVCPICRQHKDMARSLFGTCLANNNPSENT